MRALSINRYTPDEIINPHPRFGTLTRNIRLRRGRNVEIAVRIHVCAGTRPRLRRDSPESPMHSTSAFCNCPPAAMKVAPKPMLA